MSEQQETFTCSHCGTTFEAVPIKQGNAGLYIHARCPNCPMYARKRKG